MIKFQDGELIDLLPSSMKNDTDMICLSHALKMAVMRLLAYERSAMTQNFVGSLPEKILDVLAVELRSPYYLDSMGIGVKREIIKNTLAWHAKAGTPAAVEELVSAVFGSGQVEEWFEYGGDPYCFKVKVSSPELTQDASAIFASMIGRVKNARSHLEAVEVVRPISQSLYACVAHIGHVRQAAAMEGTSRKE